jgi:mannosyl-oligosaccharide alpha-1,2-mannosidase
MKPVIRRKAVFTLGVFILTVLFLIISRPQRPRNVIVIPSAPIPHKSPPVPEAQLHASKKPTFDWSKVTPRYPVTSMVSLPTAVKGSIPRIQANFKRETADQRRLRMARLDAVKSNFTHAWRGYKAHAWLRDEVMPISGQALDPFGGWAATLVDALGLLPNTF